MKMITPTTENVHNTTPLAYKIKRSLNKSLRVQRPTDMTGPWSMIWPVDKASIMENATHLKDGDIITIVEVSADNFALLFKAKLWWATYWSIKGIMLHEIG